MVDPIGTKPITTTGQRGIVRAEAKARSVATGTGTSSAPTLAASLSSSPPIDIERVATVRRAIAEGRFPLTPSTIADRIIALKLNWTGNDQA